MKLLATIILLTLPAVLRAQMLDPAIDRDGEPFCYFSQPTDVIGVMDGPEGTLVTPEGYLYTGSCELMFFTGNPPEPVRQRVKTLERGYLPIINYSFSRDGIHFDVSAFAATLDGLPESPLMNFVRVNVRNPFKEKRTAFFGAGCRYQNDVNTDWGFGDNRFARPEKASQPGARSQEGELFDSGWTYELREDYFLRGGRVVYLFPTTPAPERRITLKSGGNTPFLAGPEQMNILPTTPAGVVVYTLPLDPGQEATLDLKLPYEPLSPSGPEVAQLRSASYDEYRKRTVDFWEQIIARGIAVDLPERKVADAFKANLVYDLIARDKQDGHYIQKVNEFQYDAFWLRDASCIVHMYDVSGYHDIAGQCLGFFPRWQLPDGNYLSQGGQFDGWGQAMYAFGQHYRITRDREFAASIYPSLRRAVAWLQQARRTDPLHLIPATTPGDNEDISGHVTGHNFIALGGLRNAIAIAEGLGNETDATAWREEYSGFLAALRSRLSVVTSRTGGYMPPGLDSLGGQDWGNMESVYPEQILDPHDPMVTSTLEATRAKYREGIMTYGDGRWLHHYLTISNTETEVIRGDQQTAIDELYALLLHTSATHAGFEYCILSWSTRDFGMNLAPHGWFAARFRTLLRDMLVREDGNTLHLFSCLSPEWVHDGATIAVRKAPTYFGVANAALKCTPGKALVTLQNAFAAPPDSIVLHIPWFMNVRAVRSGGKSVAVHGQSFSLPPTADAVEILWEEIPGTSARSYQEAVQVYKTEYRKRYQHFLMYGTP
jgi:hypothetical protein